MTDSPATVSASQVSLILERAAEIDARGDVLAVDELRRIAAEAGIDAAATEMAIQEIMADREAAPVPAVREAEEGTNLPAKKPESPSPEWIVGGGAVGTAFGFVLALPNFVSIPALGATVLYLLFRAVKSMKTGSQLSFQLQNFAVWLGTALGATAIGAFSTGTNFASAFICWIVISVIGGMIVRFGPREEEAGDGVPRITAGEEPDGTNPLGDPS
ncbi:MAG: hypothetical protein F4107_08715 [Gemmatimonadetes bacterium]|nr:hypothetical protein [Gemmatimonadota bacterium]MXX34995.1 hypothetical protein [Gemmatimonadota bacterium]MYD13771.1 hypothetical protein [Gemmatimonadota bacterium]MYI65999.1 hypothetical protein [Gemmatimonadota bacterium]